VTPEEPLGRLGQLGPLELLVRLQKEQRARQGQREEPRECSRRLGRQEWLVRLVLLAQVELRRRGRRRIELLEPVVVAVGRLLWLALASWSLLALVL
jgi:hypothetical protein